MTVDVPQRDKLLVTMLGLGLGAALVEALMEASKLHGGRAGPWLDQLEQEALEGIRTISVEGASIDSEAAAYRTALVIVSAQFTEARSRLGKPPDE